MITYTFGKAPKPMKLTSKRSIINAHGTDIFVLPAIFDDCIVGIVERFGQIPVLCYSQARIIDTLEEMGMSKEEAETYFRINCLAPNGTWSPVFLDTFELLPEEPDPAKDLADEFSENINQDNNP